MYGNQALQAQEKVVNNAKKINNHIVVMLTLGHFFIFRERRPRTPLPSARTRPKSSSITNSRTAANVSWGDYDMLTADIVHNFQQDDGLKPNFGEKITIIGKDRKGRLFQLKYDMGMMLTLCIVLFSSNRQSQQNSGTTSYLLYC